jgi:hypothetical protein
VEIISHGVWLYCQFCLSDRDVEELLFVRGILVTYETIRIATSLRRPDVPPLLSRGLPADYVKTVMKLLLISWGSRRNGR